MAITHKGLLALETLEHQGQGVLSCPGSPKDTISERTKGIVGDATGIRKFGRAIDVIIRPDQKVRLVIDVYKMEIADISHLRLPKGFSWYSRKQLSLDPRCKRDRRLYLRLLEKKPLDVVYSEEQLGNWIDAKMLYWRENS